MSSTRLVLWDLDHTLIESRGVGRAIYERVFPHVTGQPLRTLATVHGRTELDIISDTLEAHDIPATDEVVSELAEALAAGFREARDELVARGRVLPGARKALERLDAMPHVRQTLLTGNTRAVAVIKTKAFNIDSYLDLEIGAYGDDHRDRSSLVSVARHRVRDRYDTSVDPGHVLVIGDTPNDVTAALASGTQLIAVATGYYGVDELTASGASVTLANLADADSLDVAFARAGLTRE